MKLIHISDLHLGKRLLEQSLLDDQRDILDKILRVVDDEQPQGVLIAGDVYDKSVPSAEAVALFDDFLSALAGRDTAVFIIAGNHDSPERIAFGYRLMAAGGVYLSPLYRGAEEPVRLSDQWGEVDIHLLPFLKPAMVRAAFPEAEIDSYTDAVKTAVDALALDKSRRHVLVCHQFVTGASTCESEVRSVGGSDNVDGSVFDSFDYVALGHIHGPQCVGRETVRYSGTPLKYSFSEREHEKSVTVVELREKGSVTVRTRPLQPLRELRRKIGMFDELMAGPDEAQREDLYHLTLTDEESVPDAVGRLRTVYPHVLRLDYDNSRTRSYGGGEGTAPAAERSALDEVEEFFRQRNGREMSKQQRDFVAALLEETEGEA